MADPIPEAALQTLLRRLVIAQEERSATRAPRAINCKTYSIGESFPNFVSHFKRNVQAAYAYTLPADEDVLKTACLSWLPTKLEPGPTLEAYESLSDTDKADWDIAEAALKEAFADEAEKEMFLADAASFRRGSKSLVHYKNELQRLMNTYLPELSTVPAEFQRQACTRFIEGLEDGELKRLLRRHCRREKMTLEEAYLFTVDHESSEIQTRIREEKGAATFGRKTLGAITDTAPRAVLRPSFTGSSTQVPGATNGAQQQLKEDVLGLTAKTKISEMKIQELSAKSAHTNDRLDILSKEVGQTAVNMTKLERTIDSRLDRIEQLLISNNNTSRPTNSQPTQNSNLVQYSRGGQQGNTASHFRGNGNRGRQSVQPSLTGGPGFVRNQVQPGQY